MYDLGMSKPFITPNLDQQFLLPPDMRDWLPEGHLVWFIDDVVVEVRPEPHHDFDSVVEMRSRSRLGISDFGVNIFRLRDLKVRLLLGLKPLEDKMLAPRVQWEQKNADSTGAEKK